MPPCPCHGERPEDLHSSGLPRSIKSLLAKEEWLKLRALTMAGLAELKKLVTSGDAKAQEKIDRRHGGRTKA